MTTTGNYPQVLWAGVLPLEHRAARLVYVSIPEDPGAGGAPYLSF